MFISIEERKRVVKEICEAYGIPTTIKDEEVKKENENEHI